VKPDHPVAFKPETAADAWLGLLAARGVEYLFANGGTDFAPVVEAYAKGQKLGWKLPQVVIVPHENMGVAMAHGYTMITGKPQAMMVHVGVGTANSMNGLINASRQNVPILFSAGRTPLTESGALPAARNNYIHWAQEHFDQGGMLREFMKWDYELRHPEQVETVLDRESTSVLCGLLRRDEVPLVPLHQAAGQRCLRPFRRGCGLRSLRRNRALEQRDS